jgi:aminoglycoside phosphotransferase (APT) family kinase protein
MRAMTRFALTLALAAVAASPSLAQPKADPEKETAEKLKKAHEVLRKTGTGLDLLGKAAWTASVLKKQPDLAKAAEAIGKVKEPVKELGEMVERVNKATNPEAGKKAAGKFLDKLKLVKLDAQAEELKKIGKPIREIPIGLVTDGVDDQFKVPHPALELGLRWLRTHAPPAARLVPVHGDYRVGNFAVGPEGLRAVLDWENVHLSDPHADLAWISVRAWRFGQDHLPVGGVSAREPFYAAYEAASGHVVDCGQVFYWEVLGNLQWALGALGQARRHLNGLAPSLELASLGRVSAEMEWEVLNLIEYGEQGTGERA